MIGWRQRDAEILPQPLGYAGSPFASTREKSLEVHLEVWETRTSLTFSGSIWYPASPVAVLATELATATAIGTEYEPGTVAGAAALMARPIAAHACADYAFVIYALDTLTRVNLRRRGK